MTRNISNRSAARAERRLVHMSSVQLTALRRLSKRTGTSQQALIRTGIDLVIAKRGRK
jgi:hypothetical protein